MTVEKASALILMSGGLLVTAVGVAMVFSLGASLMFVGAVCAGTGVLMARKLV